jgi:two-component system chemotaxis response regulator CheB
MFSSLTAAGAAMTMQALEVGAVDFVCKPRSIADVSKVGEELILKVKGAARLKRSVRNDILSRPFTVPGKERLQRQGAGPSKVVAIGASSGGPYALRALLPRIPRSFAAGIVVVQHMPENFTTLMAHWLDEICEISVKEASCGDLVTPGTALIAPGGYHLRLKRGSTGVEVVLERGVPVNGHMPSVEVLFRSVAKEFGRDSTAVIMTGMGNDGSSAIGEVKKAGGRTVAQDEESCAVYGMPRLAVDNGFIEEIIPLSGIAEYLVAEIGEYIETERWGSAEAK